MFSAVTLGHDVVTPSHLFPFSPLSTQQLGSSLRKHRPDHAMPRVKPIPLSDGNSPTGPMRPTLSPQGLPTAPHGPAFPKTCQALPFRRALVWGLLPLPQLTPNCFRSRFKCHFLQKPPDPLLGQVPLLQLLLSYYTASMAVEPGHFVII